MLAKGQVFLRRLRLVQSHRSRTAHGRGHTENDYSYIWRPAIEEHEQNGNYDFAAEMIGTLRSAAEAALRETSIPLDDVLSLVEKTPGLVFRRIRVHLIGLFADRNVLFARQTMMNREWFNDHRLKHEYARLMGARLPLLEDSERCVWFSWLDAGPHMAFFEARFRESEGRDATEEDRRGRRDYWKFERFHWVQQHLDEGQCQFYEQILAKHGVPELADLNVSSSEARWGDESPFTIAPLQTMGFEAALELFTSWQPSDEGPWAPTLDGLLSSFGEFVGQDAVKYSGLATQLVGRPEPVARAFITRMTPLPHPTGV